jgi:hypothetical protein
VASNDQQWVVAPDESRIEIAIGPDARLSPELRQALDQLAQVLEQQQEVQGYTTCEEVSVGNCRQYFSCKGVY